MKRLAYLTLTALLIAPVFVACWAAAGFAAAFGAAFEGAAGLIDGLGRRVLASGIALKRRARP